MTSVKIYREFPVSLQQTHSYSQLMFFLSALLTFLLDLFAKTILYPATASQSASAQRGKFTV